MTAGIPPTPCPPHAWAGEAQCCEFLCGGDGRLHLFKSRNVCPYRVLGNCGFKLFLAVPVKSMCCRGVGGNRVDRDGPEPRTAQTPVWPCRSCAVLFGLQQTHPHRPSQRPPGWTNPNPQQHRAGASGQGRAWVAFESPGRQ